MYRFISPLIFLVPQDSNLTHNLRVSLLTVLRVVYAIVRLGYARKIVFFPRLCSLLAPFRASLDGFSSGFLVSSCIKADRLPKLRIFLPQGLLFVPGACQKCTNMIYRELMIIGSNVTAG